jgi:hypothetical protein
MGVHGGEFDGRHADVAALVFGVERLAPPQQRVAAQRYDYPHFFNFPASRRAAP